MATALDRKAEKIASELEEAFPELRQWVNLWDQEEARRIIKEHIPLSDAMAEEAFDEALAEAASNANNKPGPAATAIGRLRKLLHGDDMSIVTVLNAAADKLAEQQREIRQLSLIAMDLEELARENESVYEDDNGKLRFTESGDLVGEKA